MTQRKIKWWAIGEVERLLHATKEEAIKEYLETVEIIPATVEVVGYAPMEPELPGGLSLDCALDYLYDEYGDPDEARPRPTESMLEAERVFHAAILAEYTPWMCEPVRRETVRYRRKQ